MVGKVAKKKADKSSRFDEFPNPSGSVEEYQITLLREVVG